MKGNQSLTGFIKKLHTHIFEVHFQLQGNACGHVDLYYIKSLSQIKVLTQTNYYTSLSYSNIEPWILNADF